jgi:ABC-type multidrug transport system ATPase subunit
MDSIGMTEETLLSFRAAEKLYGRFPGTPALRGVDLDIQPNERVVILGPNGAGKSTLLRLLLGIMRPTRGTVEWRNRSRPPIGFAPEHPRLLRRATVSEYLHLALADRATAPAQLSGCIEHLQIGHVLERRNESLSKGEAQRISLAFTFLVDAPVIVLDEPFEGLDPMIRPLARAFIFSSLLPARQRTLIATTHRLEEVREPFERVVVMNGGRVVKDLSLGMLTAIAGGSVLVLPRSASAVDVQNALTAHGLQWTSDVRAVRGSYGEAPAILVGPWTAPARPDDLRPLDLETLLQLWLQPVVSS